MEKDDFTTGNEVDQGDLFGGAQVPAYIPNPVHVRNRLGSLLEEMRASTAWPWEPAMVRLHRERTFEYLCSLIPDAKEAAGWRKQIAAEVERLDAAA